ncbi:MAG: HAD family hydrolase [Chloroflexi bacterium]|nr:HAD family hydrolase [Chloroflexota bacterium]
MEIEKRYPAIFLDRDGVIIENRANYVRSWEDVEFFPQALAALARIREAPYKIILITNQSAVGRGIISYDTAVSLNNRIIEVVRQANGRIDAAYICPAAPDENAPCRKPQPGMLLQAAADHQIDLSQSVMIGDALTDIQAGHAAGVRETILLLTGRGEAQLALVDTAVTPPFTIYKNLDEALTALIP